MILLTFTAKNYCQKSDTTAIDYDKIEASLKYQSGKINFTTGNATLISANSQRIQATINTKGKIPITEYGVCWNLINDFL